jgi:hypothetical protein
MATWRIQNQPASASPAEAVFCCSAIKADTLAREPAAMTPD